MGQFYFIKISWSFWSTIIQNCMNLSISLFSYTTIWTKCNLRTSWKIAKAAQPEWYSVCLADPLRSALYTESDQLYMYVFEQRQFTAFNSDVKGLLWPLWVRLLNAFLKWQPNHLEWYSVCLADPLRSTLYTESDQLYMYVFEQRQFAAFNSDVKGLLWLLWVRLLYAFLKWFVEMQSVRTEEG